MDITEKQYEQIDKIIRSAVDRTVHSDFLKSEIIKTVDKAVAPAIELHVNGKIRRLTEIVSEHIEKEDAFKLRMEPLVIQFEEDRVLKEGATKWGKNTIFASAVLASIGSLLFFIKELLKP